MQKILIPFFVLLATLNAPTMAASHSVVEREIQNASQNPAAYPYVASSRRVTHHHHHHHHHVRHVHHVHHTVHHHHR
ncbi:MAG: hypothetical protein U0103_21895 [Candidatus Obscuribacterales bacterium]|nr:hypothetical protein [Cyanobacteria bacterium SZAS LIN-5]